MQSFGRRRNASPDGDHLRLLNPTANGTTVPPSVKFESEPVARPGDLWLAASCDRQHLPVPSERRHTVSNCLSIIFTLDLFGLSCEFIVLGAGCKIPGMPNIASILKEEIIRVARKEIRNELASLRKTVSTQRSDLAELKRRALAAEKGLGALNRARAKQQPAVQSNAGASSEKRLRFSAKSLASNRERLGLSAEQFGLLVGVGSQSIYNWEAGESRPRDHHLAAIAELKTVGKKEASARLQALKEKAA